MPNSLWGGLAIGALIAAWRWNSRPEKKTAGAESIGRRLGSATKAAAKSWDRSIKARLSYAEARAMLGVEEDASQTEIETAYRRLMLRAHPDHGGTDGLAAQLTAARDWLIKKS